MSKCPRLHASILQTLARIRGRRLQKAHIFADLRRPDVLRVAPAPLYNGFGDVRAFVEALTQAVHVTHRGALWASGAAQAAQYVRIILRWRGVCSVRVARE